MWFGVVELKEVHPGHTVASHLAQTVKFAKEFTTARQAQVGKNQVQFWAADAISWYFIGPFTWATGKHVDCRGKIILIFVTIGQLLTGVGIAFKNKYHKMFIGYTGSFAEHVDQTTSDAWHLRDGNMILNLNMYSSTRDIRNSKSWVGWRWILEGLSDNYPTRKRHGLQSRQSCIQDKKVY